mgnify:CR=1 FL=1
MHLWRDPPVTWLFSRWENISEKNKYALLRVDSRKHLPEFIVIITITVFVIFIVFLSMEWWLKILLSWKLSLHYFYRLRYCYYYIFHIFTLNFRLFIVLIIITIVIKSFFWWDVIMVKILSKIDFTTSKFQPSTFVSNIWSLNFKLTNLFAGN